MNASRKLILAVSELHRRGFEKLRLEAGLAPSGCYWRYRLQVKGGTAKSVAGSLSNQIDMGWGDTPESSPSDLADAIVSQFPDLIDSAKGENAPYVTWLASIIEESAPEGLFIEYWDSYDGPCTDVRLINCNSERAFPQPPA